MIALLCFVLTVLVSPFKSKSRLEAENAALRHQVVVLRRMVHKRVRLTNGDRLFFIQLYRWFPSILQVITVIGPSPALAHLPRQSALDGAGAADLLLQKHDAVEQRLRGRPRKWTLIGEAIIPL